MESVDLELHPIDLSCRNISTLIEMLAPHVPYSLQVLGTLLNTGTRPNTLQEVDPAQVSLWSTMPLHSTTTTHVHCSMLFSIISFSHLNHQFSFFCSGEFSGQPTEVEERHVRQVFERLRDMARVARPTYDSVLVPHYDSGPRHRTDNDPPMIVVGGVHAKWTHILAPLSTSQYHNVRYTFPKAAFRVGHSDDRMGTLSLSLSLSLALSSTSEIQASDIPFVRGASSIPRSEAYFLSRAPYSVCIRRVDDDVADGERPVACVLMHSDGSIGALRVDPEYQRQGFGTLVVGTLIEKMDFNEGRGDLGLFSDGRYRDMGGGALGWNWTDVGVHNEVGNRFFTSLVGEEGKWACHWTYMDVSPKKTNELYSP